MRLSVWLFLVGAAWSTRVSAAEETRAAWIRGVFTGNSPRPQLVAESEAWRRAEEIVSTTPGTFTLVGGGESMQPLYPPGTILVLREVDFAELRSGETALYRNRAQRAVAHVLVAKCRDGWRVRGLNNATHDPEPVVSENLIGIVFAAFTPANSAAQTVAAICRASRPVTHPHRRKGRCRPNRASYVPRMTKLAAIQSAILQLDPAEREELRHWLDETAEETPEMLAAIDAGLRSLKETGTIPLEDVRRDMSSWTTKSV